MDDRDSNMADMQTREIGLISPYALYLHLNTCLQLLMHGDR